ncbi:hypothetical protein [Helicobacter sp. T3_23-1059]
MAAPIIAVAAKTALKTYAANKLRKKATETLTNSATKNVASKTPYLDKLRAMKPKNKDGEQQAKSRERINIAQDLMSETAIVKMLDDLLQKFQKVRENVSDNIKKQGLSKEIYKEASKNAILTSKMDSIAKGIKETNKPLKHRNKMR